MALPRSAILVPAIAFFALAQQPVPVPPPSDTTIRLNVLQVLVPVVVLDKKGHAIGGLRSSDFQVEEDGVTQDIVGFTREASPSAGGAPLSPASAGSPSGPVVTAAAPRHTWVICFDALHASAADFVRTRDALARALVNRTGPDDQFVLLSIGRQLRIFQPATTGLSRIQERLKSKEFANLLLESTGQQLLTAENEVRRRMDLYCSACPCGRDASNRHSTCDVERQQIKQDLDSRSQQFAMYDTAFFAALKSVIQELAKLDGRRSLILISDGFTLTPGRELFAVAGAYLPNSPYFKVDPSQSMQPALEESLKIAAAQNIVVNTIDNRGNYTPAGRPGGLLDASNAGPGSTGRQEVLASRNATNANRGGSLLEEVDSKWSSVEFENGSALSQLAKATGGVYFHDNNDFQKSFREALEDNRETYLLAYVPKNSARDGKFRRITVTVAADSAKTRNCVVRAKAGYWADGPTSQ